ncbi:MAG: RHS repeat protein, partial [Candidatus Hydrogenedentes bacterium]|nr:RHS repeat protein [Candidatus Hydrogenedentota bacterium]
MRTLSHSLAGRAVSVLLCALLLLNSIPPAAAYPALPLTPVSTLFAYDGNGNMISRIDGNGATTTFAYDALNRLTSINYPGGASPDVTFTYDVNGNRTSMTDATGTTQYTYDLYDRLTGIDYPGDNFIRYGYDDAGNITDLQYGNWIILLFYGYYTYVQYAYDEDHRITSVTNIFTGDVTSYQYGLAGNVSRRTLPNGAYTDYGYDADGRLTSVD